MHDRARLEALAAALRERSLTELAEDASVSVAELEGLLVEGDLGGSALDAPWWPEAARRIRSGMPVRAVARCFQTNPRRLRRALARACIRTGGVWVPEEGLAALVTVRPRLGCEPDGRIAKAAGVSVEAVQGERRRLGISPFRPEPPSPSPPLPVPKPAAVDLAPRRGRPALPAPTVVRRAPAREVQGATPPPATSLGQGLPRLSRPVPAPAAATTRPRRRLVRPTEGGSDRDQES